MALGTCPECGAQVSTKAERCPGCGRPTARGNPVVKGLLMATLLILVLLLVALIAGLATGN